MSKEQQVILLSAYSEYRKSAKKTAYKTDLLALHKGWLAFGVELDSFCERETNPPVANIQSVGMTSLLSSKLYGINGDAINCVATSGCPTGLYAETSCPAKWPKSGGTTCVWDTSAAGHGDKSELQGPGKANLIGFTAVNTNCQHNGTQLDVNSTSIRDNPSTTDAQCELNITTYKAGVFGQISGDRYIGFEITNNGVIAESDEVAAGDFDDTCA